MDLGYGAHYEAFRDELKAFLAAHWPPQGAEAELPRGEREARFRGRAIEAGYLARGIPRRYGGSEQPPDVLAAAIIREEFRRAHAPGDLPGIGPQMFVPTLLEKGAEWQKEKFVGPTIRGEIVWCQGYSEPASGSDLASLQTRAELQGDEWVIHGQKIWTSGAHQADYMFCLCRTEPEAEKHAGISYLLLDMHQAGVTVRPLRMMTGDANFNQVFLDGVRTPKDWIVGRRGEGWLVSRTTLKHERNSIGNAEQVLAQFEGLVRLAGRATRGGRPAIEDPRVRQRLAEIEGYVRAHQYSGYYQLTKAARGESPGIVQSMNKLNGTNIVQRIAKLALELLADDGLLDAGARVAYEAPKNEAGWVGLYMGSLGGAIAGGTANIQRNIIAERGLGLPRDFAAQRKRKDRAEGE
jgi:alkylation response protein AidB-like acyl-CoA dehydrogenase